MSSVGHLIGQNLRRNARQDALAAIGVVIGVAVFCFFLALDQGVRRGILDEMFPADRLEVIPSPAMIGDPRPITEQFVADLANPPADVSAPPRDVYGRMLLAFPARGWGGRGLLSRDRDFIFEISGFCEGIDARVLATDIEGEPGFNDRSAEESNGSSCDSDAMCPEGLYCATDLQRCLHPVPTVVSRHIFELYNTTLVPSHPGLPRIPSFSINLLRGQRFSVELGRSHLGMRATQGGNPIRRTFQLVGVSDKGMPLGITIPVGYVRRWNAQFAGKEAASQFSSVTIWARRQQDIPRLAAHARQLGLTVKASEAERLGLFMTLATAALSFLSLIIVTVSVINIAHLFLLRIAERRREIGVLRAVGATRGHIRAVIWGEAIWIGVWGGVGGVLLAWGCGWVCDVVAAQMLPDFPFKPESFFRFTPWVMGLSLGLGALFCLLGSIWPARRAARVDVAQALTGR